MTVPGSGMKRSEGETWELYVQVPQEVVSALDLYIHMYIYICMYMYVYMHLYTQTNTHVNVYICIYKYMNTHVRTCIYVCICEQLCFVCGQRPIIGGVQHTRREFESACLYIQSVRRQCDARDTLYQLLSLSFIKTFLPSLLPSFLPSFLLILWFGGFCKLGSALRAPINLWCF